MPGNGVAPKLPEQRRRRNVPTAGEWVTLPSEPYSGPRPATPELKNPMVQWTWEQWWSSPMAHMWTEADWPGLVRLILMLENSTGLNTLKEVRLQEERFGLSPKGRQGLRWRLPSEEKTAPNGKVLEGRWQKLQVVDAVPASN